MELALQKSEALILRGKRRRNEIKFTTIKLKKKVKYPGIYLDSRGSYSEHIKETTAKEDRTTAKLFRIMSNIVGPSGSKGKVLVGVSHSTLLYEVSVWEGALNIVKYRGMLKMLRIASVYRLASAEALQIITGSPSIQLMVEG